MPTYNIGMSGQGEVARVAELLFLKDVCSYGSHTDASYHSNQTVDIDCRTVNRAHHLIYNVFRLCDSILYSDDPMTELENSAVMEIRLSHASQPDNEIICGIQSALRRSFLDALEFLHTNPKFQPGRVDGAACARSILELEDDIQQYVPVLTRHMNPDVPFPARVFNSFHSALDDIVTNHPELMRSTDLLSCYQPEIAVLVLLALQYRRSAIAMVVQAHNGGLMTMVDFLYYDLDTRSILTTELVHDMAPLLLKYLRPAISTISPSVIDEFEYDEFEY